MNETRVEYKTRGYNLNQNSPTYNTVTSLGGLDLQGNILPPQWLQHLTHDNGKPNVVAAIILSDIVYWYRPVFIRDESTGLPLPPRKKFKEDKVQRSYDAFVEMYGFTKRQVSAACKFLKDKGLIDMDFRTITMNNGRKAGNVLYIGLNVEKVREITLNIYPYDTETSDPYHVETLEGITSERDTNTETTYTETTYTYKFLKEFINDEFIKITNLTIPGNKNLLRSWWTGITEMLNIFNADGKDKNRHVYTLEEITEALERICVYMRRKELTIGDPHSMLKTLRGYAAQKASGTLPERRTDVGMTNVNGKVTLRMTG